MKDFILITGASTGIGYEMAMQLAAQNKNLILVARSIEKLKALQQQLVDEHGIEIHIFPTDLSNPQHAIALYGQIKNANLKVTMLVNNAGIGSYGHFTQMPLKTDLDMIGLNISSLVALTKLFGDDMKKQGYGRIMNVASLLSFLPLPYYSVYSATKCFVLAFSETLAAELEDSGVIVTDLCPGPVDTPFTTPQMLATNAYKTNKPADPETVAKAGVNLLLNGRGKKIVGFNNWFIAQLPRITPSFIMIKIKKLLAFPNQSIVTA